MSTVEDVKKFHATLKEIVGVIEAALKQGKTAEAIKKEKLLAKWDQSWGQAFIKTDEFIDIVYTDLKNK